MFLKKWGWTWVVIQVKIFFKTKTAKKSPKIPVQVNEIIHQAQFVTPPHGEDKSFPSIKRHGVRSQFFHGK